MHATHRHRFGLLMGLISLWTVVSIPAFSQQSPDEVSFPQENFVQINPTLPNHRLNFDDDSRESCCAKDYTPDGQPVSGNVSGAINAQDLGSQVGKSVVKSEFEKANPHHLEYGAPSFLVSCDRFAQLPQTASATGAPLPNMSRSTRNTLPIVSYSTNVSVRQGAAYFTDPNMRRTSDFHIETAGGEGLLKLHDVNNYSVCMARGGNVAMVANTDNGSILTYNGNDHIYLAGNNTNMLTRTGGGEDLIELHQAQPRDPAEAGNPMASAWAAWNIYKTAISGGAGEDTLVIKGTPFGTKWCHIGGYRIYGEYFYVVEFALPPSVTEGPRRQRINIGASVEYVVIKGKKYRLNDFLVHGEPVNTVARDIPVGDALPRVSVQTRPFRSGS